MPQDTRTPPQGTGYPWPVEIVILYFWQIAILIMVQVLVLWVSMFELCFKTCRPVEPKDAPLIIIQVANFGFLVLVLVEIYISSNDKLTVNKFLNFQIPKVIYAGLYLFLILWATKPFLSRSISEWFTFLAGVVFATGSFIISFIYAIVLKGRSREQPPRDEERPLLAEGRPSVLPELEEAIVSQ